jgi:hypothetical protein
VLELGVEGGTSWRVVDGGELGARARHGAWWTTGFEKLDVDPGGRRVEWTNDAKSPEEKITTGGRRKKITQKKREKL